VKYIYYQSFADKLTPNLKKWLEDETESSLWISKIVSNAINLGTIDQLIAAGKVLEQYKIDKGLT
jgi:hypothetical protein